MNPPEEDPRQRMERVARRILSSCRIADMEAARAREEAAEREQRMMALRARWNAPERHLGVEVDRSGRWGECLASLERKNGTGILVGLIGPPRTGKTQMAVELMKRTTERGKVALYRTATELLMHFKATYRPESKESELDVVREHRKPALLVIDEYARRAQSEWEDILFFELLNRRYADLSDTLILSNLGRSEFEAWLGPSLNRRVAEAGGIVELHVNAQPRVITSPG